MAPRSRRAEELLPPSRLKERRRKNRLIKLVLWLTLLLVLVVGFVLLTYLQGIRIREVTVEGSHTISSEVLQKSALQELSGKYLWAIPKDSILLYSTKDVSKALLEQFPKLKRVDVSLANFHTIALSVEERTSVALWCGTAAQADAALHSCYFIDTTGYVYEEASDAEISTSSIEWFGALDQDTIPAQFLDPGQFHSVQLLVEALRTPSRSPERVVIDANKDVFVRFSEGFEIRFTLTQKPEEVLALLKAAENSSALSNKTLSDLLYLDLRFGERLYYKFK